MLNREAPEYVRFVNPSDYRVVRESCGACHIDEIKAAERSLMATGAMFYEGASYNNGIVPLKTVYIARRGLYPRPAARQIVSPGSPPGTVTPSRKSAARWRR